MWTLLAFLPVSSALFFGGGGGCGCGAPPACPPAPPPVCAPALPAPCPAQPSCGGGYGGASFAQPFQAQPFQQLAPALNNYARGPLAPLAPAAPVLNQGFAQPAQSYAPQLPLAPQAPLVQQTPIAPQPLAQPQVYQPQAIPQTVPQQVQVQPQTVQVAPAVADSGSYQQGPPPQVVQPAQQTQENYQTQATEVQPAQEVGVTAEEGTQYKDEGNVAVAAASKNAEVIEEAIEKSKSEGKSKKEGTEEKGEEKPIDITQLKLTDDPLCNSDDLRNLMLENMDDNLNSSKRLIQLAAEAQFGGRFDVICANGDFSYVTNTELYCQETKGDVSCYTYRQL